MIRELSVVGVFGAFWDPSAPGVPHGKYNKGTLKACTGDACVALNRISREISFSRGRLMLYNPVKIKILFMPEGSKVAPEAFTSTRDRIIQFLAGWALGSASFWLALEFSGHGCMDNIINAAIFAGPAGNIVGVIGVDLVMIWRRPKTEEFEYRYQSISPASIVLAVVFGFSIGIPSFIVAMISTNLSFIVTPFVTCLFVLLGYILPRLIRGSRKRE